jgi:hypothetical protein
MSEVIILRRGTGPVCTPRGAVIMFESPDQAMEYLSQSPAGADGAALWDVVTYNGNPAQARALLLDDFTPEEYQR